MRPNAVASATSLALLLVLGGLQSAAADASIGGTSTWTVVGPPTMLTLEGSPAFQITFHNDLTVSVFGIVMVVLHNGLGQTVYYTTATTTLTRLGIGPVYAAVVGVPAGSYNATFFAMDSSGVGISAPTTAVFVIG
ncbi:MAG: hypothetical protein OK455_10430 [Thaumarchaeota archaeon]|nr:hypothetical protein [Nitrososphaerota archaeon]